MPEITYTPRHRASRALKRRPVRFLVIAGCIAGLIALRYARQWVLKKIEEER